MIRDAIGYSNHGSVVQETRRLHDSPLREAGSRRVEQVYRLVEQESQTRQKLPQGRRKSLGGGWNKL